MIAEETLIENLKQKDTQASAFEVLINTYKERLYWHIRRIVLDHDDTDDVLQNTFIKVFRNIDKFKGASKLYSWMYRIATNEALSFLKKPLENLLSNNQNLQAEIRGDNNEVIKGGDLSMLNAGLTILEQRKKLPKKYADEILGRSRSLLS